MSDLIVKKSSLREVNNRLDYGIRLMQNDLKHFVIWTTRPENPFGPHKHAGFEFWYILEGEAIVSLDGQEYPVEAGDLIYLPPQSHHGLRTTTCARWICLG